MVFLLLADKITFRLVTKPDQSEINEQPNAEDVEVLPEGEGVEGRKRNWWADAKNKNKRKMASKRPVKAPCFCVFIFKRFF